MTSGREGGYFAAGYNTAKTTSAPKDLVLGLDRTAQETRSAGGDETGLLTRHGVARDGRRLTNVLVVTTTVRVVDGVHGDTTGLEHGLVDTATTGNDADRGAVLRQERLLGARGETDAGAAGVDVVADDGCVVARGACERATVARLLLDVADDRTLRHLREREDVADDERGLLAAEDERAGGHALGRDKRLGALLVAVRVTEDDLCERCAASRVVHDLLDETADVAVALGIVERAQACCSDAVLGVRREDAARLA